MELTDIWYTEKKNPLWTLNRLNLKSSKFSFVHASHLSVLLL